MQYYPTIKKKETLSFATVRMNLEDIMVSEIGQTQKGKYRMIWLICRI